MKNFIKVITVILIMMLTTSAFVYADDDPGKWHEAEALESIMPDVDPGMSSDELFAGYVEKAMMDGVTTEGTASESNGLSRQKLMYRAPFTGVNALIYNELSKYIKEVAEGQMTSTVFSVDLNKHGYSFYDINNVEFSNIIDRLLVEFPYELYWYDKTEYTSYGNEEGCLVIYMPVAAAYSALDTTGTYFTNDEIGQAVVSARDNARDIVYNASGLSDIEKLNYYKETINGLTDYNDDAYYYSLNYGDPWQLIWVFDGDPSTKVVCEGYSKAFKYLCDLTDFDSHIQCRIINGAVGLGSDPDSISSYEMGGHMWNLLFMDDGKNYLADLTNCDEGNIGADDKLFLKGYTGVDSYGRYYFDLDGTAVVYDYDTSAINTYTDNELVISGYDYVAATSEEKAAAEAQCMTYGHDYGEWVTVKEANCTENGLRVKICSVCQDALEEEIAATGHNLREWKQVIEPTYTEYGLEIRGCSDCEYTEERQIDMLEPEPIYADPEIELSATSFTYNGKKRKPEVTVWVGYDILEENVDYTVKYASGRKNVGKYKITVELIGGYEGRGVRYFRIVPKGTTIKSVKASSKALTIKWNKQSKKMSTKRISGYQIQLATNASFTKNKKNIKVRGYKKVSYKVKGLKARKKYYVRIRTYRTINGVTYYSPWSKATTKKTR